NEILLAKYELNSNSFSPGDTIHLVLTWKALRETGENYKVFVYLLGSQKSKQRLVHLEDQPLHGGNPTSRWHKGEVIKDEYRLPVPEDAPFGRYKIEVGMYHPVSLEPLPVQNEQMDLGDRVTLGPLTIEPPRPQHLGEVNFKNGVTFLGYDLFQETLHPGDSIYLALYWQARADIDKDYTVFTQLLDSNDKIWAQKDNQPQGGSSPTSTWSVGEVIKDRYQLAVKPSAPPGRYRLAIGMYLLENGRRLAVLNPDGQVVDDKIVLAEIEIKRE
ncbi:MAG: hypothetical protein ACE5NP_00575, partial [Anaerolineae bacterium]